MHTEQRVPHPGNCLEKDFSEKTGQTVVTSAQYGQTGVLSSNMFTCHHLFYSLIPLFPTLVPPQITLIPRFPHPWFLP